MKWKHVFKQAFLITGLMNLDLAVGNIDRPTSQFHDTFYEKYSMLIRQTVTVELAQIAKKDYGKFYFKTHLIKIRPLKKQPDGKLYQKHTLHHELRHAQNSVLCVMYGALDELSARVAGQLGEHPNSLDLLDINITDTTQTEVPYNIDYLINEDKITMRDIRTISDTLLNNAVDMWGRTADKYPVACKTGLHRGKYTPKRVTTPQKQLDYAFTFQIKHRKINLFRCASASVQKRVVDELNKNIGHEVFHTKKSKVNG